MSKKEIGKKLEINLEILEVYTNLAIAENALLFYSRMRFHPRDRKIAAIIDDDNGKRATKALEKINPELAKPFFDDDREQ